MGIPDLEDRLRGLRMADPGPGIALRALETLRLKRRLRMAWSAAAATFLLAAGVGMSGSPAPAPARAPRFVEVEGIRRVVLAEARPGPRAVALAFAERKSLETRLLEGGLR